MYSLHIGEHFERNPKSPSFISSILQLRSNRVDLFRLPFSTCPKSMNNACPSIFVLYLAENTMETYKTIETAFGDDSSSRSVTFEWFIRFKDGQPNKVHVPENRRRPETTTLWQSNVKKMLIVFLILKV